MLRAWLARTDAPSHDALPLLQWMLDGAALRSRGDLLGALRESVAALDALGGPEAFNDAARGIGDVAAVWP